MEVKTKEINGARVKEYIPTTIKEKVAVLSRLFPSEFNPKEGNASYYHDNNVQGYLKEARYKTIEARFEALNYQSVSGQTEISF